MKNCSFFISHMKKEKGVSSVWKVGRSTCWPRGGVCARRGDASGPLSFCARLSGSSGGLCRAPETLRWWLWPITQDAMFPNHITYIAVNSGDKGLKGGDHSCLITTKKIRQTRQSFSQEITQRPGWVLAWWGSALSLTQLNPRPSSCFQSPLITSRRALGRCGSYTGFIYLLYWLPALWSDHCHWGNFGVCCHQNWNGSCESQTSATDIPLLALLWSGSQLKTPPLHSATPFLICLQRESQLSWIKHKMVLEGMCDESD